jgi:hypothetical protein
VSSNFGNEGERNRRATEGDAIAGQTIEKPLMYFCFDLTPELDTVALTCPKIELDNNNKSPLSLGFAQKLKIKRIIIGLSP